MHHPGQHDVVHVARLARDLRRQLEPRHALADEAVLGRRLLRSLGRNVARHLELPIRALAAALEQLAQLGARLAQALAAILDREAAGGDALVRAVGGARWQDAHFLERHAQLFGGDLRERSADALAKIHLAARDCHRAVALEMHALREPPRVGEREMRVERLIHALPGAAPSPRGYAT